jgi:hypothetical protein
MSVSSDDIDMLNDDSDTSTRMDENQNDYYDDESLSSSVKKRLSKINNEGVVINKHRVYRTKYTEDGYKKICKVEFYETPNVKGRFIVDAITGHKCAPYLVGTEDEDLFFSTMFATGETGRNASLLFFDSPEQYERHFNLEVSTAIKERWLNKVTSARLKSIHRK